MASLGGHGRPNLKICIDNEEDGSSSDEDMVSDNRKDSHRADPGFSESDSEVEPDNSLRLEGGGDEIEDDVDMDDVITVTHVDLDDPHHSPSSTDMTDDTSDPDIRTNKPSKNEKEPFTNFKRFEPSNITPVVKKYENKAGDFITGFDPTSKENVQKKVLRAKRFGIKSSSGKSEISEEDVKKLYKSLGVTDLSVTERGIRLEALHMRGVDDMSTEDIFKYFQEYSPGSMEWIDDTSCNVVWLDKMTTARALLALSKDPDEYLKSTDTSANKNIKKQQSVEDRTEDKAMGSGDEYDDELDLMSVDQDVQTPTVSKTELDKPPSPQPTDTHMKEEDKSSDVAFQTTRTPVLPPLASLKHLPPGKWRIAKTSSITSELYFRFATKADKKLLGAEKHSNYYVKYGNPNYGGIRGLITEGRKRKLRNEKMWHKTDDSQEESTEDIHGREKVTYLEEAEFTPEAEEWGVPVVRRPTQDKASLQDDTSQESYPEMERRTKDTLSEQESDEDLAKLLAPPVKKRYMRMHADDLEEEIKAKRVAKPSVDARSQIEKRRQDQQIKKDAVDVNSDSDNEEQDYTFYLKRSVDLRTKLKGQKQSKHKPSLHSSDQEHLHHRPRITIQVQHE